MKYTREQLLECLDDAIELFNYYMNCNFSVEELKLDFYTSDNALNVYRNFCSKYFPDRYEKEYERQGRFDYVSSMAFVNHRQRK